MLTIKTNDFLQCYNFKHKISRIICFLEKAFLIGLLYKKVAKSSQEMTCYITCLIIILYSLLISIQKLE